MNVKKCYNNIYKVVIFDWGEYMGGECNCNEVIDIINILNKHNAGSKLSLEYIMTCLNRYEKIAKELAGDEDDIRDWIIIGDVLYNISNYYLGYKSKYDKDKCIMDSIFKDLYILEVYLDKIKVGRDLNKKLIKKFISNLKIFNKEEVLLKRININRFYYDNIKNNDEIKKILDKYLKYKIIDEEIEIHKKEFYLFIEMWKDNKIKSLLKYDTELYFRLIRIFKKLDYLKDEEVTKENLKRQISIIDKELYPLLDEYTNSK